MIYYILPIADNLRFQKEVNMKASLQIKNSIYQVVISYKDSNNKSKTKWFSTQLKEGIGKRKLEEVRKSILEEFEKTHYEDLFLPKPQPIVSLMIRYEFTEYLDIWLEDTKTLVEPTTYKGYKSNVDIIKKFFAPLHLMLDEVKHLNIQDFYRYLYKKGLSGNTVLHYHTTLSSVFRTAMKSELITYNILDKIERPKCGQFTANYYQEDELMNLFKTFEGDRMELCVHIAAYYGLRRSEVVGLRRESVNFNKKIISINHKVISLYGNGKEELLAKDKLKNSSSRRSLPLLPHIEKLLLDQKNRQDLFRAQLGASYNTRYNDYICTDLIGNIVFPGYISNHFAFMVKKIN